MGMETSLKDSESTESLLSTIVNMGVYPLRVLIDSRYKSLTRNFTAAIFRIFRILDRDHRSYISSEDVQEMERKVFSKQLPSFELFNLYSETDVHLNNDKVKGISKETFVSLFKGLLDQMKISYCWVH